MKLLSTILLLIMLFSFPFAASGGGDSTIFGISSLVFALIYLTRFRPRQHDIYVPNMVTEEDFDAAKASRLRGRIIGGIQSAPSKVHSIDSIDKESSNTNRFAPPTIESLAVTGLASDLEHLDIVGFLKKYSSDLTKATKPRYSSASPTINKHLSEIPEVAKLGALHLDEWMEKLPLSVTEKDALLALGTLQEWNADGVQAVAAVGMAGLALGYPLKNISEEFSIEWILFCVLTERYRNNNSIALARNYLAEYLLFGGGDVTKAANALFNIMKYDVTLWDQLFVEENN